MLIGSLVVAAVVLVPGGVFAWQTLDGGGTQPHDVLPGDAIGYVRIDLDPSATQKIEAVRFLDQFPAFQEELGLSEDDDIREFLVEEFNRETGCELDFAADIEPWIGDRAGVGILPPPADEEDPEIVLALQVQDEEAATATLDRVSECDPHGQAEPAGYAYLDGYLIVAETAEHAERFAAAADDSPLGADDEFTEAMRLLGDPGVASVWFSGAGSLEAFGDSIPDDPSDPFYDPTAPSADELREMIDDAYRSIAMTFRFSGGYAEVATVVTGNMYQELDSDGVRADLPETTTLMFGLAGGDDYIRETWDALLEAGGDDLVFLRGAATAIGLTMPDDLGTMLGDNLLFAVDASDLDVQALTASDDFSSLHLGLIVDTDPAAAQEIWRKLTEAATASGESIDDVPLTITDDGYVIASSEDYAATLVEGGALGDSDAYTTAVKDAAEADSVFFLDLDAVEEVAISVMEAEGVQDEELIESLRILRALGYSTQIHDGYTEATFRITTE